MKKIIASLIAVLSVCAAAQAGPKERYHEEFQKFARLLTADQKLLHGGVASHLDYLLEQAASEDPAVQVAALRLLGKWDMVPDAEIDHPGVARVVREALESPDPTLQRLGLYYLSFSRPDPSDTRLIKQLLRLAREENEQAIRALGAFEDHSLIPYVRQLMEGHEDDPAMKRAASYAMARLGDEGYRLFWLSELESPSPTDRRSGALAATYIRDPRAVPLLVELLLEEDGERGAKADIPLLAHKALVLTLTSMGETPPVSASGGDFRSRFRRDWERWWRANRAQFERMSAYE